MVKLADFGVSKINKKEVSESQFKTDSYIGTLKYMCPMRLESIKYGFETDLWSLGIILLELCLLKYPYESHFKKGEQPTQFLMGLIIKDKNPTEVPDYYPHD